MRGVTLWHMPTTKHVVVLTFDGGSGATGAPAVISTLRREGVPATFFLTGTWVRTYPARAAQIAQRWPVGNHTMTHPHLPKLTDARISDEIVRARTAIVAETGRDPRPLFRFPYGDTSARALRIVNGLGYVSIGWTVDTLGWMGAGGGRGVESIVARVVASLRPGEIVLMHLGAANDHTTLDADALGAIIDAVRAHGYGFATIPDLMP